MIPPPARAHARNLTISGSWYLSPYAGRAAGWADDGQDAARHLDSVGEPAQAAGTGQRSTSVDNQGGVSVRVVIAEDMALLRQGLARLLTDAGFDVAGSAGDADELLEIVARSEPDAALIDIKMPPYLQG